MTVHTNLNSYYMYEAFIATITCIAGNFAPRGWAFCSGQIMSIQQNTALFSLLGTTFGGNGQTTFALPNLAGRVPIGAGNGAGLSPTIIGDQGGATNTVLAISNLPMHAHTGIMSLSLPCFGNYGSELTPDGFFPAGVPQGYGAAPTSGVTMKAPAYSNITIGIAGGSQPFSVMPPYQAINYIICLEGIFPSRN